MVKRVGAYNWSCRCIRPKIGSNIPYISKNMPAIFSRGWKAGWHASTRERTNEGFHSCCGLRYLSMAVWVEGGLYLGRWFGHGSVGMVVMGGWVVHISVRRSRYSLVRLASSWLCCI